MGRSSKKQGIFVTFEGTEGAGKSTLIRNIAAVLQPQLYNQQIVLTREPGGNPLAERIRAILLEQKMDPRTELFLYEAARAEHLVQVILPALERGDIVLCDRFTDSSLAYQGYARGLPWQEVKALNKIATRGIQPDLTVLLDIDPEVGLGRAREHNRFEAEGVEFQKRVRKGFLKARSENSKRWLTLPVQSESPMSLAEKVIAQLEKKFKSRLRKAARA